MEKGLDTVSTLQNCSDDAGLDTVYLKCFAEMVEKVWTHYT